MFAPKVQPRIEKARRLPRYLVEAFDSSPLVCVAMGAGQCQVRFDVRSASRHRKDVIDWKSCHLTARRDVAVFAPGMWSQLLTTREPRPDQVEVALAALNSVIEAEHDPALTPAG